MCVVSSLQLTVSGINESLAALAYFLAFRCAHSGFSFTLYCTIL